VLDAVDTGAPFWGAALKELGCLPVFDEAQLRKIPTDAPVIFIANHPFGFLDGLTLCHLAQTTKGSFKIFINIALCREPRLNEYMLPVDFAEDSTAKHTNGQSARRALRLLSKNGTLVLFPAGGISTAPGFLKPATDLECNPFIADLARISKATTVPVYFHGQNSRIFQCVSILSMKMRLALIIREVRRHMGKPLKHRIGDPLPPGKHDQFPCRHTLTSHLRSHTYSLSQIPSGSASVPVKPTLSN